MSDAQEQSQPTRKFFERDPRAISIRNICFTAIDAATEAIREGNEGRQQEAIATLLDINRQLQEMGIVPEMHTIPHDLPDSERTEKRQELISSPVMTMEWIAGQLRDILETSGAFTNGAGLATVTQEYDHRQDADKGQVVVDLQILPPKALNFVRNFTAIGNIRRFIDYSAGPTEQN